MGEASTGTTQKAAPLAGVVSVVLGWYAVLVLALVAIVAAQPGPDPTRYCMGCAGGFFDPRTNAELFSIVVIAPGLALAAITSLMATGPMRRRYPHVALAAAAAVGIGVAVTAALGLILFVIGTLLHL
jgi:hypothetical protein